MKIIQKPDLKNMSTLKMGGQALADYYARDYRDLEVLGKTWAELGPQVLIMGRGSNILFQDGKRELSIVVWDKKDEPVPVGEDGNKVQVLADAGMSLPGFLRWCAGRGLTGPERLTGIPGSLGGAIAMNAGAYGLTIGELLESITIWSPELGIMEVNREGFTAGYRSFELKELSGPCIVLKARLTFEKSISRDVRSGMKKYYTRKKNVQPILKNTAGCIFKNPPGFEPAGVLLEKAGFRGKTRGNVCFSSRHSNFLVNIDNGSSRDALELISQAGDAVQRLFGAGLELEVKVV